MTIITIIIIKDWLTIMIVTVIIVINYALYLSSWKIYHKKVISKIYVKDIKIVIINKIFYDDSYMSYKIKLLTILHIIRKFVYNQLNKLDLLY